MTNTKAIIFDLDGTLLQTEKLKALSYAKAAVELCPYTITEDEVIDAFKGVVGLSRREVAMALVERFDLNQQASARMDEFGVTTPWQAYIQVRLKYYQDMINDPSVLRENQWPFNVGLLEKAREWGCHTALATMSHCEQVSYILSALDWENRFDFVATRDDVINGKPDPEIYNLVSNELNVAPPRCIVIEDSPTGVEAAVRANMHVIAVSTPFTKANLHASQLIDTEWIVDDTSQLLATVERKMQQVTQV